MKNLIARNLIHPHQTKPSYQLRIVALTFLATVIPLAVTFAVLNLGEPIELGFLTRDPAAITKTKFYIGLFSNIGILLWCSAATVCLFSYEILKQNSRSRELSNFLLFSGLLTAFLTLDDLLMLHEMVIPVYLRIKESWIYLSYILMVLFVFVKSINVIKKTEFIILFAAVAFFALSIVSDRLYESYFVSTMEEISKLIGITTWLTYLTRLCVQEISNRLPLSAPNED